MAVEHPLLEVDTTTDEGSNGTHPSPAARPERAAIVIAGREYHWLQVLGAGLVVVGVIAIAVGWFGVSGTDRVWEQMPYFVSGGIGGSSLITLGVLCLLAYEHRQDRFYVADLLRQQKELEFGLAGEFDALLEQIQATGNRNGSRSRVPAAARSDSP